MSRYAWDVALLNYIQSLGVPSSNQMSQQSYSTGRAPTSAEIDAVIAAAIANAPPAPSVPEIDRSVTPLMTNLLPSAVGQDGRVNLFVGNVSMDTFNRQARLTTASISRSMAGSQGFVQKSRNGVACRCQLGSRQQEQRVRNGLDGEQRGRRSSDR